MSGTFRSRPFISYSSLSRLLASTDAGHYVSRYTKSSAVTTSSNAAQKLTAVMDAQYEKMKFTSTLLPIYDRTKDKMEDIRLAQAGNKNILDFSKNSYLGLGCHPKVIRAASEAADEFGVGIGTTRIGHGSYALHKKLECQLTQFLERDPESDDTVVLPTGYHANLALFEALTDKDDVIFVDSLIHGSAVHGVKLSKARKVVFRTNNLQDLEKKLQRATDKRQRVIAVDGVYSMDGFCAELPELKLLADQYNALLMVDDSHGVGVIGTRGKGTEEYKGAMLSSDIITGSLSKGLAPTGGFITAPRPLTKIIRSKSLAYTLSAALTPPNTAAASQALDIASSDEGSHKRTLLRSNAQLFRKLMKGGSFTVQGDEEIPICPVMFKDPAYTLQMAREILEHNILTLGVTTPFVPHDAPRIRIILAAYHTEEHIRRLVEAFTAANRKLSRQ